MSDLDWVVVEHEVARASLGRPVASALDGLDAVDKRAADAEDAWLQLVARKVDEAVARILAEAEREVAERRARRDQWLATHKRRVDAQQDASATVVPDAICGRPRKKTL